MNYKNWYCITVGTNKEKSIKAQILARKSVLKDRYIQDIEYPERKELSVTKDGTRKVKSKLLMPGYLLIQILPEKIEDEVGNVKSIFPSDAFNLILQTPGVKRFANCNKDKPVAIRPREVKKIFDLCDDAHLEVKSNIQCDFYEGDILDVVSGPFSGHKCEIQTIQGDKILAQLDMFGRIIPCEFTKDQLYKHETKTND